LTVKNKTRPGTQYSCGQTYCTLWRHGVEHADLGRPHGSVHKCLGREHQRKETFRLFQGQRPAPWQAAACMLARRSRLGAGCVRVRPWTTICCAWLR
jgi:hypothetical protein